MINISLPDGSVRSFDKPVSGADIAAAIGPGLAKAALAVRVDGKLRDLSADRRPRRQGRDRHARDPEALELLRHDAAHVLAEAVQELYPGTQVTFGPAIEDGFYYDFARDEPFTPEDFAKIEAADARDRRPRRADHARGVGPRDSDRVLPVASARATRREMIDEHPHGRGDHALPPGRLARPVPRAASAVDGQARQGVQADEAWRAPTGAAIPSNAQLQRIYGTAWADEGARRPTSTASRKPRSATTASSAASSTSSIMQEEAVGMVFWHPKGWTLWRTHREPTCAAGSRPRGYVEVKTPQLLDRRLWEAVRATGRSSARTCSSPRKARSDETRLSR